MTAKEKLTKARDEAIIYLEGLVRPTDRLKAAARSRLDHIENALAYLDDTSVTLSFGGQIQLDWAYSA